MRQYDSDQDPNRPMAMPWDDYRRLVKEEFTKLLNRATDEKTLQVFLEQHPSLLPGAGDGIGHGGHHGAWWDAVVTQPELKGLGPTRYPDFMFVRRDTATTKPICIEIESPRKSWFNKDLAPSAKLTQALDQLNEWRLWFKAPENDLIFRQMYVPEAYRHRALEPEFVLVYGRDSEFRADGPHGDYARARSKRSQFQRPDQWIFTFDMLKSDPEGADYATIAHRVHGFEILNIPTTFTTCSDLMAVGSLMDASTDIAAALDRNTMIDPLRREYIAKRWSYWLGERTKDEPGFRDVLRE